MAIVAHDDALTIVVWLGMTTCQYGHTIQLLTLAHLEPNTCRNSFQTNPNMYSFSQLQINGGDCTTTHRLQGREKLANTTFQTFSNILHVRYSTMSCHFVGCCFLWETFPANICDPWAQAWLTWRWVKVGEHCCIEKFKKPHCSNLFKMMHFLDASATCFTLYPSVTWQSLLAKLF